MQGTKLVIRWDRQPIRSEQFVLEQAHTGYTLTSNHTYFEAKRAHQVMEFHDVLHGHIVFDIPEINKLVSDLLRTTELQRLRSMRQMNFDVPLIQELGRSRRLPHSIGVAHLSYKLAIKACLELDSIKELVAAALLHDAAIPPYGHLVETEFRQHGSVNFDHAKVLRSIIFGRFKNDASYKQIMPNRYPEVAKILNNHDIDLDSVLDLVAPKNKTFSPISADIDIDNIDNVHRMAVLLGWEGAKDNAIKLISKAKLDNLDQLLFDHSAEEQLSQWMEYRQRIYTMIIAHKDCLAHNALQSDLIKLSVENKIISTDEWFTVEPIFEERLRSHSSTKALAEQLITGCEYQFIDYVWFKDIDTKNRYQNSDIKKHVLKDISLKNVNDIGYFVWFEKNLISRSIRWRNENGDTALLGESSASCIVAIVKKTPGGISRITNEMKTTWRQQVSEKFAKYIGSCRFKTAFPEDYTGSYFTEGPEEFQLELQ